MDSKILADLLPIILIFLFAVYASEMQSFSHTTLGKLCIISVIVYYTRVDAVYGLFACVAFLLYYETLGTDAIVRRGLIMEESLMNLQSELNTNVTSPMVISDYKTEELPMETYELDKYPVPVTTDSVWSNIDRYDSSTFSYSPFVSPNESNERVFNEESPNASVNAIFRATANIGNIPYAFSSTPSPSTVPGMSPLHSDIYSGTLSDIYGGSPSSLDIYGSSPSSLDIYGSSPSPLDIYGSSPSPLDIYGSSPSSLDIYGSSPSSLDISFYDYSLPTTEFSEPPSSDIYNMDYSFAPTSIVDKKLEIEEFLTRPTGADDVISDTLSQFAVRAVNGIKTLFLEK